MTVKASQKEYQKAYRAKNREKAKQYAKTYYQSHKDEFKVSKSKWEAANPDKLRASKLKYARKHKEERKVYNKQWAKNNAGKVTAYARAYQIAKINAMPKWLSPDQMEVIESIYVNRPEGYHVDHIVPLQGKTICGLHVPWNLQYLPATENIKKSNKLE